MQTNSVSLEDFNSKYLQSQERFKSFKPSSKPGPVSFFGLVVFLGYQSSIFTSQKIRKYRGQKLDYRIDKVQRLLVFIRGTDLQHGAGNYRVGLTNSPIFTTIYTFLRPGCLNLNNKCCLLFKGIITSHPSTSIKLPKTIVCYILAM